MHIIFNGPVGAPFVGKPIDLVTIEGASLEDLAALQRGTKLPMKQLMAKIQNETSAADTVDDEAADTADDVEDPYNDTTTSSGESNEMFKMQVAVFLALRTAGYRIHWRIARDMKFGDFDMVEDDTDDADDDEMPAEVAALAGPPMAATASGQAASVAAARTLPIASRPSLQ